MNTNRFDKNAAEIKTGCVVRISNAFFKNENGTFLVTRSPGDPAWLGDYFSLTKVRRDGKLSETKYRLNSWPLVSYISDREKSATANAWNQEHAEIEIVEPRTTEFIRQYFLDQESDAKRQAYQVLRYWDNTEEADRMCGVARFYASVAERLGN